MFYTSNYGELAGQQCNPPCTCGYNGTSCLQCPNDQQCHAEPRGKLNTFMRWSNSTDGPWSTPLLVPAPTAGDTNCACVIRNNGSLVCMGRPGLGMFRAAHWRDIESYTPWSVPGGIHIVGEDPVRTKLQCQRCLPCDTARLPRAPSRAACCFLFLIFVCLVAFSHISYTAAPSLFSTAADAIALGHTNHSSDAVGGRVRNHALRHPRRRLGRPFWLRLLVYRRRVG